MASPDGTDSVRHLPIRASSDASIAIQPWLQALTEAAARGGGEPVGGCWASTSSPRNVDARLQSGERTPRSCWRRSIFGEPILERGAGGAGETRPAPQPPIGAYSS